MATPILDLGLRGLPSEFRFQAYAVAAAGALRALYVNVLALDTGQATGSPGATGRTIGTHDRLGPGV